MKKSKKKYPIGLMHYDVSKEARLIDKAMFDVFKKRFDVVFLPLEQQMDFEELALKTKPCQVIMNFASCDPETHESLEIAKSLEELGKTVINSTHSFYYQEDKWMFYLKCLENQLPTPKTYLIHKGGCSRSHQVKKILEKCPLVIKSTVSDNGNCVERASTYAEFQKKLKKILQKNPSDPVIAQEYIPNTIYRSFRATLIDNKLVQFVEKTSYNWKQTGHGDIWMWNVPCPPQVKRLAERAAKVFGMPLCGLDMLKYNDEWFIIEANSSPSFRMVYRDQKKLSELLCDYLEGLCRKLAKKRR